MSYLTLNIEQTRPDLYVGELEIGGAVCKRKQIVAATGFDLVTAIGAAMYELAPHLHPDLEDAAKAYAEAHPTAKPAAAPAVPPKSKPRTVAQKGGRGGVHMVGER